MGLQECCAIGLQECWAAIAVCGHAVSAPLLVPTCRTEWLSNGLRVGSFAVLESYTGIAVLWYMASKFWVIYSLRKVQLRGQHSRDLNVLWPKSSESFPSICLYFL